MQGHGPQTWGQLEEGLRLTFLPLGRDKLAREKLSRVRQRDNEHVASYTSYIRRLFLAIPGISEDEKLDRYLRGMTPAVRKEVFIREPTTFEEAVRLATRYDAALNFGRRHGNTSRSDGPAPMELGATQYEGKGKDQRIKVNSKGKSNKGLVDPKGYRCWACNETGHLKRDCPNRKKTQDNRH
jgi:hypothetical protein